MSGQTCFNPRPRAGGDGRVLRTVLPPCRFQSTPPRGGRLPNLRLPIFMVCFNPRPRAGGDDRGHVVAGVGDHVSIHAPARGATISPCLLNRCFPCFNPRPRAGGDPIKSMEMVVVAWFQSTPPRGGRHLAEFTGWIAELVSIHAPARGATIMGTARPPMSMGFNPRPRAGGDCLVESLL